MKCWCVGAYVCSVDLGAVRRLLPDRVLRGHHDPGGPHLALDVPVLVEAPVDDVVVVRDDGVERDDEAPHPPHLRARHGSTCFQSTALSSSWMQIAFLIVRGVPCESCVTAST